MACGIPGPGPGIKPILPALESQSPKHWTTREVPETFFLKQPLEAGRIKVKAPQIKAIAKELVTETQVEKNATFFFKRKKKKQPNTEQAD